MSQKPRAVQRAIPRAQIEHVPAKDEGAEAVHRPVGKGRRPRPPSHQTSPNMALKRIRSEEPAGGVLSRAFPEGPEDLFLISTGPRPGTWKTPATLNTSHPSPPLLLQQAALLRDYGNGRWLDHPPHRNALF